MAYTGGPARTRFAPSPTGYVHIGSMRTVLFNWLLARGTGGQFLLRVEDTDRKRYVEGAEEQLKASLRMMDLQWDEGPDVEGPFAPYHQSERLPIYHRYAEQLEAAGHLYKCFCTSERLKQVNDEKIARREPPGYDRHCRYLTPEERQAEIDAGKAYVLRLAVPLDGETVCQDLLRGPIVIQNRVLTDQTMVKSDGFPTYHLAAIVDDHEMQDHACAARRRMDRHVPDPCIAIPVSWLGTASVGTHAPGAWSEREEAFQARRRHGNHRLSRQGLSGGSASPTVLRWSAGATTKRPN